MPAIAAPAADAIPKHLDATLPDGIRYAHQAAQMETIAYTPVEAPLHYLDTKRQPADKPVKDGYYRKELGKTADGRLVVQHFYQNSDKPASAPFLLKKDAAPDSDLENADGKIVQYQKDGSIFAVETRRAGLPSGRLAALYAHHPGGQHTANHPVGRGGQSPASGRGVSKSRKRSAAHHEKTQILCAGYRGAVSGTALKTACSNRS